MISRVLLLMYLCGFSNIAIGDSLPKYLKRTHMAVLEKWLAKNPGYRLAIDEDCACDDVIKTTNLSGNDKNYFVSSFHPYYVGGDFNGNGIEDFAVALWKEGDTKEMALMVFNGPFNKASEVKPAFFLRKALLYRQAIFFFPRRKSPRLLFGSFESDSGCLLKPSGKTYKLDCSSGE